MHIYGIAALIVSLWPTFMRRIRPWLSIIKGKQKQAIQKELDEIERFASEPFDALRFTKDVVECLTCLVCSVAFLLSSITLISQGMTDVSFLNPWMKVFNALLYFTSSVFFGFSFAVLIELRRRLKIKLDPQKAAAPLRAKLETLQ
ncbi:hypothetical protein FUT69_10560 [Xylella taiwanensis]|nr:hypothetical protein [Xylella taiwanensis]AXI82577.1 hypothetical protein AB672_00580 [Xylella taiwanensis]MCD8467825.1 hypothetical protein [Xylella taiwanensis]NBI37561.1 hypothetical protein [Xylella taiwanensis]QKD99444.1 hypothetical protein PLS229_00585 [Xylella taiwanensis]UFN12386.1 hypothetical protein LPH44_00595 [Xylella taiwanensis]